MSLKSILNKIANTGIDDNTPFDVRNKLRVFNNANFVIFGINIFYITIGLVQHFYSAVWVTVYSIASCVLCYFLVKANRYKIAFHYTVIYGGAYLSAFSILFGGANNSYYFFLFVPVACNILFDKLSITILYALLSTAFMIANIHYVENYAPIYDVQEWMRLFSYPNLIFATLLIFMGVRLFKEENKKYSLKIEEQKKVLEEKNKEITDSINYAKKIQSALIPSEQEFNAHFKESFVLFKPKDIVSGDFYWAVKMSNKLFYVTGDCTGHGVPGGFMTMLGISYLDEIITEKNITEPAEILNALRDRLIHTLKQTGTAGENKDGMDVVLCRVDLNTKTLCYAAANNSLYILRDSKLIEYKGDKQPCGFHHEINSFTQHELKLNEGDRIYTFTDGFPDQFGGPKGKKYKYKQLEDLVISNRDKTFSEQKTKLENSFENWKGDLEQIDDVCVIGVGI